MASNPLEELRGATRLAVEATQGVTGLVEAMHRSLATGPALSQGVYGGIRGVTGLVGKGLDVALGRLVPLLQTSAPGEEREAVLAAVCGVLGDYLEQTDNPLALPMELRHGGRRLRLEDPGSIPAALSRASSRLLVMVHGACMTEHQWLRAGHDHGLALTRDAGWTRIGVRYNSGLHVSTNGARLAEQLQSLVAAWPVPLDAVALLGHSMGGLVSRSAIEAATVAAHPWRTKLHALITLGTPHHGAPLERAGNWIDVLLDANRYSAPLSRLGKIRSAGVTDLRYGNVVREDWEGRDRFAPGEDPRASVPLPADVRCCAVAATLGPTGSDGLVPVDSALGRHKDPARTLAFAPANTVVVPGTGHRDLLSHRGVYASVRGWLSAGD